MDTIEFIHNAIIFLMAALFGIFLLKRMGMGAVLGYLLAGIVIGPYAFGLVDTYEETLHFAELGVVFLLFMIGLELSPQRLWAERSSTLGFGGLQVTVTGIILSVLIFVVFDFSWPISLSLGFGFSLSSTAVVLQVLSERNELASAPGRLTFGNLLFQDVAAIPMIALVPLLASSTDSTPFTWQNILVPSLVVAGVILFGIFVLERSLHILAKTRSQEALLIMSLLLVLGIAAIMHHIGLSMALGSFLGGVILSNSDFKHLIESSLEPFKNLLMGLFFLAVGMSINLPLAYENAGFIVLSLLILMSLKFGLLFALTQAFRRPLNQSFQVATNLCQAGEFVFIILTLMASHRILDLNQISLFKVIVGLSMLLTPILVFAERRLQSRIVDKKRKSADDLDSPRQEQSKVLVVGYGRFGQIASRILKLKDIAVTLVDNNPDHIRFVKKFGVKVYFGDARNTDLLRQAGAEEAQAIVVALDDPDQSLEVVKKIKHLFPHLRIFARARNRQHLLALRSQNVEYAVRDTYYSSLRFTQNLLEALGLDYSSASEAVSVFEEHDERILAEQQEHYQDDEKLGEITQQWTKEMERLLRSDTR